METYLKYLKSVEDKMLELIGRLVKLESPTTDKPQTDQLATFLKEAFEQHTGGTARIIENQTYGNHVVGSFGDGEEQILIVGHFDTVHPIGVLQQNPFRIEDRRAYGPGIYDMKTGLVQAIFALSALKELGTKLNKRVVCVFNADEEIGSVSSRELLIEEAKKSKYAFVLEPSFGEHGAIKIARKGVGTYKVSARGIPAHAGICPEEGVNAIEEISRQVLKLQGLNDYATGKTVNCGVIRGGTAKNTVPEYAEITIDVRASTLKDSEELHHAIMSLTPHHPQVKLQVEGHFTRQPMEKSVESERLYQQAKEWMSVYCNRDLPAAFVGGASDGNITSLYVPTLDGLGAVGDGAHSLHEYIQIEELVPRTAILASLIEHC